MKQARILICNDDGFNAEGIRTLEQAALLLSDDVWVVAPATEQSGKGHAFTANGMLTAVKIDDRHYTVDGTPTDCVLFAFNVLLKDKKPDFVFAGVNHGSNLGFDVVYSGTTGVAMEGTLQGAKSYAFSLYNAKHGSDFWSIVPAFLQQIVEKTASLEWGKLTFLNVNFPAQRREDVAGIRITRLSSRKIGDGIEVISRSDQRTSFKIGCTRNGEIESDSDTFAVQNGYISITPVSLEMTDRENIKTLNTVSFP